MSVFVKWKYSIFVKTCCLISIQSYSRYCQAVMNNKQNHKIWFVVESTLWFHPSYSFSVFSLFYKNIPLYLALYFVFLGFIEPLVGKTGGDKLTVSTSAWINKLFWNILIRKSSERFQEETSVLKRVKIFILNAFLNDVIQSLRQQ